MSTAHATLAWPRVATQAVLDALFPQTCGACGVWIGGGTGIVCSQCRDEIEQGFAATSCQRCGRTLPRTAIHESGCARCRSERTWNVAGVARVGQYAAPLRRLLLGLKYVGHERNAAYLGTLLAEALRQRGWAEQIHALVPVPMHPLRRLQRPCDHAYVLAEALGEQLHVPVWRAVRRVRHSVSQTGLKTRAARFENVRGCFAPARRRRFDLAGKTVCVVDNLIVAGATTYEVSKVLRRAGAKRIYAAAIARPPSPGDPVPDG